MEEELKPGDQVRVKAGGGNIMTIEKLEHMPHEMFAHCTWVNPKTKEHKAAVFPVSALRHVDNGDK